MSFTKLADFRDSLSPTQRRILDDTWSHFVATGEFTPAAILRHRHRRRELEAAVNSLGGHVVMERHSDGKRRYMLTLLGALLTSGGVELQHLLSRCLDYVLQRFEESPEIQCVTSEEIKKDCRFDDSQLGLIQRLTSLYGPSLLVRASSTTPSGSWVLTVYESIDTLRDVSDLLAYIEDEVLKEYDPSHPVSEADRAALLMPRVLDTTNVPYPQHMPLDTPGGSASEHVTTRLDADWNRLPVAVQTSIAVAWRMHMPPTATALYNRWWQLETWLRSLIYVELRSAHGASWAHHVPANAVTRQTGEKALEHMPTADAGMRLAYTDVSKLFSIIEDNWRLFEPSLLSKPIWIGRVEELRHIRNRIGHCRRPHSDDLSRLEQTLRDLEPGAFKALSSFNRQFALEHDRPDSLADAWVRGSHAAAVRLVGHAQRQYETSFQLSWSRRPWSNAVLSNSAIAGAPGHVWHAEWTLGGRRILDVRQFWDKLSMRRDLVLLVCTTTPFNVQVSFSAMEEPGAVADAIGDCFDLILMNSKRDMVNLDIESWSAQNSELDPRVQVGGPWSIVCDSTTPITLFGA